MYLRKFFENEYNQKNMKTLICTNTLMEGINTPTEQLIVVDNPATPFELNNLIGRVGRLNVKAPTIGKVILCDKEILNKLVNTNTWMDLKILAEEEHVGSNDEVLYLNKEYSDLEKKKEYESKLNMLKTQFQITSEKMIEKMVEFDKTVNFVQKGIMEKLISSKSIYECIEASVDLLGKIGYLFRKEEYNNLNLKISYLPYKTYINKLLNKVSYKQIVEEFNNKYNISHDLENINVFIDALYELNNYIKFKLSKIVNYIELFELEEENEILKEFKALVSSYSNTDAAYKILEDLGIEEQDINKIIKILDLKSGISTSNMIRLLRMKKDILLGEALSPFSKNNIKNL